jgi:peptidoglycan DL-endopeptidase RipA
LLSGVCLASYQEESTAVQEIRTGRRGARSVAAFAVIATVASLLFAPGRADANPPPNPSDHQISAAQQQKNNLAAEVGRLSAQVAQMQAQLERLKAERELAEQKLAFALSKLADAKTKATAAKARVSKARADVVAAQRNYIGYIQASYMGGDVTGTTGSLLTAHDPNVLLEEGALNEYQNQHQLSAIGNLQRATVAKSNADADARQAVAVQKAATDAAENARQEAVAAVAAAQRQQEQLESTLAANQSQLQRAQLKLATLNNQRARFQAYQVQQARIAAARAAALERAREAAAAAAAARASSGGGGGGGVYVPPGPRGHWTPSAGQRAAARAVHWLGEPYAWAGGNASGPTFGVCAGDGAFNDCNVVGFDCSGLTMYAWAQVPLAHYAATQYLQGSVHPNTASLMPGDLVFWSSNGTVAGIHHVAIYIGGGNVVQAPESGDIVRITPLGEVSWGYFGATRPLT